MIKANELRIGNWVYAPLGEEVQVNILGHREYDDFIHAKGDGIFGQNGFSPIPLSPEILEKCGFNKHNNAWVEKYFTENNSKFYFTIWNQIEDEYKYNSAEFDVELKSLHQLQNLYFALTGEELNYTP